MNSDVCWGLLNGLKSYLKYHLSKLARQGAESISTRWWWRQGRFFFTEKQFDSVDVLFGLWWLFGAKPPKKTWKRKHNDTSGENHFSRKKVFGGGMLSASGDTISEWNGLMCPPPPPKKIMAEMPEMMLDPPGSRHWFLSVERVLEETNCWHRCGAVP